MACAGTAGIPPAITVEIRDVIITATNSAAVQVCLGGVLTIDKSFMANSYYGIIVVGTGTVRLSGSIITGNSFGLFTFEEDIWFQLNGLLFAQLSFFTEPESDLQIP